MSDIDIKPLMGRGNNSLSELRKRKISEYDILKGRLREKEDRRNKYSKYINEINLPLELDREGLRREATRMRVEQ